VLIAKIAVAVQFVLCVALVGALGLPMARDSIIDFFESAKGPVFHVRPMAENAILIRGRIDFGLVAEVRTLMKERPDVRAVYLDSPGGSDVEARRLHRFLADRGVTTVARGRCASACVLVFMAGRERLLVEGSSIGLHQPHIAGQALPEPIRARALRKIRAEWTALGIGSELVDGALATPPERMWYPSIDELLRGNVVTGVVKGPPVIA